MAPQGKERKRLEAAEDQYGSVFSVAGPVVVAENMIGCAMYELVSDPSKLEPPAHAKVLTPMLVRSVE